MHTMQIVHGMRFGSPLMSLAVSADNKKMVIGYVDGSLMVRARKPDAEGSLGLGPSSSTTTKQQGRFYKGKMVESVLSRWRVGCTVANLVLRSWVLDFM
jgi:hypothetical protein